MPTTRRSERLRRRELTSASNPVEDEPSAPGEPADTCRVLYNGLTERRLLRELAEFTRNPVEGCQVELSNDNIFEWIATLDGPRGTPYENGRFQLQLTYPFDYPFSPPAMKFLTKIYHCNVHCDNVCVDLWYPIVTIGSLIVSVLTMLVVPNLEDTINPAIVRLYTQHRSEHDAIVRDWTERYAKRQQTEQKPNEEAFKNE